MKTSTIVWIIVVIIIVLGGWYWYASMGSGSAYGTPTATTTSTGPSTNMGTNGSAGQTNTGQVTVPPVVTVATDPKLGSILVGANGMTLYTYSKDTSGVSNCTGACATTWPPYTTTAAETLIGGTGVTGTLATTRRADATVQVTYKGKPVYFYTGDVKAGDTTGNKVGGVWFVVKP